MFRDAKPADIPALVKMGAKFHAASGLTEFVSFDPSSFEKTLFTLMDTGMLVVVGKPIIGMAGVLIYPAYFNHSETMATGLFWWLEPEHRGSGWALLSEIEARARLAGAQAIQMASMEGLKPDAMDRLYRRAGYRLVERMFYKEV